jgi:hypothetical protein
MLKNKVFLSLVLAGCASSTRPSSAPGPDRIIATDENMGVTVRSPNDPGPLPVALPASLDSVMRAVEESYKFLKVPITYSDRATGEQGNKKFVMSRMFDHRSISDYLNCGDDPLRGQNANFFPVTVSLVTRAVVVDATKTTVQTAFSGSTSKPSNSGVIYCASTGMLEQHIADMVRSRVTPGH